MTQGAETTSASQQGPEGGDGETNEVSVKKRGQKQQKGHLLGHFH